MRQGESITIDVATGADPLKAVTAAISPHTTRGEVLSVGVSHDDGCPCTSRGAGMPDCTCEIVQLHIKRLA